MAQDAEQLNDAGIALYQDGHYEEALTRFQEAFHKGPRAIQLYNVGRCQQKLGRLAEALATFQGLLARADLLAGPDQPYRDKAAQAAAEVEQMLASLKPPATPLVAIPGGPVLLGGLDEPLTLAGFQLEAREVSVLQYDYCVRSHSCAALVHPSAEATLPARDVSWAQAADYCRFAGRRLPTEAEWERAAAGTKQNPFSWGREADCSRAVLGCSGVSGPLPVQRDTPDRSAEGIFDLVGNVSEWVADWFNEERPTSTQGPQSGVKRTVKGGSYTTPLRQASAQFRFGVLPQASRADIGFRCAASGR